MARFPVRYSPSMTILRDNIRRWLDANKADGWNMKRLSEEAGLGPTYVRDLMRDPSANPSNRGLQQLARVIKVTVSQLTGEHDMPAIDPRPEPNAQFAPTSLGVPAMPRDLPVYGTAEAGIEGAMQLDTGAVDYVRRPPALASVRDAYAVYVVGSSMEPVFEEGAIVLVHPHRPCRIGDYVIVQARGSKGETVAYIKKLKKIEGDRIILTQFNPPGTVTVKRADHIATHKILSLNDLLGA